MPKSDAQRRREADARKRAQGLTLVSVWVPLEKVTELRLQAQRLCNEKS